LDFIKNQIHETTIEGLSSQGHGVGHIDGFTFFIKGALPSERVSMKIIKLYKSYGIGKLEKIIQKSKNRTEPVCGVYPRCGGCALQHMTYEAQLEYKAKKVTDALRIIGKLTAEKILTAPCLGMENPYRYRNKSYMPSGPATVGGIMSNAGLTNTQSRFPRQSGGEKCLPFFGLFAARSHDVIPVSDCLLCPEEFKEISRLVALYIMENNISVYDESRHEGLVRHLALRASRVTGEMLVCLIINGNKLPLWENLKRNLSPFIERESGLKIVGITISVNMEKTNVILGSKTVCLWGKPYITDEICGLTFRISVNSFFQVNPVQTEFLYKKAIEYAECENNNIALDIYCGIGTITLLLARKFTKVYGVEEVDCAVQDAISGAELNGVDNVEFICAKAENEIQGFAQKGIKPDCVVLDPPRKGCNTRALDALLEMPLKKIVYISCDPATLARDINILSAKYELKELSIFDCFPQTAHVESVCLLETKEY